MNERTQMLSRMALYILGVALNVLEATLIRWDDYSTAGARIGLANLVTLVALMTESTGFCRAVMGGRIFLASLATGTLFSLPCP